MAIEGNSAVSTEKIYSRTAVSLMNSTNNFSYKDLQGENRHLPHAAIFKGGFMQDVAFRLPNNQYIMASEWFQYAGRDIPPTLTEENSEASEIDRSWRTMVSWKNFHEKGTMEAKVAYFNEYTLYKDPLASVYSTIQSQTISGSFENTWDIGKNSSIFGGTQFTYEYADLDYYEKPEDQENLAIFASYRYNIPSVNWQFSLNGRQEFLTVFHPPFLFSIGGEGKIWRFISARFNVSRNFRAPTLNERFWQPGGNPDLKPEESWNEEVGILLENHFASSGIKLTLTAFNSRVENWILWLPGGSYWSVENAGEVWARGIEVIGEQSLKLGEVKIFFSESYSYTKATNEKKLFELDASYKKQLIYTPVNRFVIRAGLTSEGYNITLKGNYTGEVFTTKDNLESLPSTFLLDAVFSKSFKMKKIHPLTLQLNLNNILNTDYQSVPYRPMPGINFLVTCRMAFGKLKIKN
jgi:iron complex outermembrane receptor protein